MCSAGGVARVSEMLELLDKSAALGKAASGGQGRLPGSGERRQGVWKRGYFVICGPHGTTYIESVGFFAMGSLPLHRVAGRPVCRVMPLPRAPPANAMWPLVVEW
jgi:hypothetical protein